MTSETRAIFRVMLVALFLGSAVAQIWIIPVTASSVADRYPEVESLAVPYSTLAILGFLALQVVAVALWRLLGRIETGRFVESGTMRWLHAIIAASTVGACVSAAAFWHVVFVAQAGGPPALFILGGACAVALTVLMLAVIQRGLLKQTTTAHRAPAAA
ncbi:DUF2975 domain-containing protein [Nesterenkonia halotolerans]|uniref:DUF2975 domain-containing protein n=1 Tax=Nesterenkonia halotolerans TaxID=225325 RepID=UPI003EE736F0